MIWKGFKCKLCLSQFDWNYWSHFISSIERARVCNGYAFHHIHYIFHFCIDLNRCISIVYWKLYHFIYSPVAIQSSKSTSEVEFLWKWKQRRKKHSNHRIQFCLFACFYKNVDDQMGHQNSNLSENLLFYFFRCFVASAHAEHFL